jgi:hypothetical protein
MESPDAHAGRNIHNLATKLEEGQLVLMENKQIIQGTSQKLQPLRKGIWKVLKKVTDITYDIENTRTKEVTRKHRNLLLPYFPKIQTVPHLINRFRIEDDQKTTSHGILENEDEFLSHGAITPITSVPDEIEEEPRQLRNSLQPKDTTTNTTGSSGYVSDFQSQSETSSQRPSFGSEQTYWRGEPGSSRDPFLDKTDNSQFFQESQNLTTLQDITQNDPPIERMQTRNNKTPERMEIKPNERQAEQRYSRPRLQETKKTQPVLPITPREQRLTTKRVPNHPRLPREKLVINPSEITGTSTPKTTSDTITETPDAIMETSDITLEMPSEIPTPSISDETLNSEPTQDYFPDTPTGNVETRKMKALRAKTRQVCEELDISSGKKLFEKTSLQRHERRLENIVESDDDLEGNHVYYDDYDQFGYEDKYVYFDPQ